MKKKTLVTTGIGRLFEASIRFPMFGISLRYCRGSSGADFSPSPTGQLAALSWC
jgi:hypothetical protein